MTSRVKHGAGKRLMGFARLSQDDRRRLARKGGAAVAAEDRAFSANRELAREAGRKGGGMVDPANRHWSKNRQAAAEAGRKGGRASRGQAQDADSARDPD